MRLHYLQHVPFEDLALIAPWARERGFAFSHTRLFEDETLPELSDVHWLVIMGGLMSVNDEDEFPWLVQEKAFIREAIGAGRTVLGICLGGQLIASALGAAVRRNAHKEIGWHPVSLTEGAAGVPVFHAFSKDFVPFHWHGDTFDIPEGAIHCACSAGCAHQAFAYGDRVVGLQFHLEYARESIEKMLTHCAHELAPGPYVQDAEAIRAQHARIPETQGLLRSILDVLYETR